MHRIASSGDDAFRDSLRLAWLERVAHVTTCTAPAPAIATIANGITTTTYFIVTISPHPRHHHSVRLCNGGEEDEGGHTTGASHYIRAHARTHAATATA